MIELREYVDARGRNYYRRWASKQDPSVRARVDKAVFRLGEGNFSSVKPEGEGVSALRLDFGPGYRVYFAQDGEQLVILLAGGTKKRQQEDIRLARLLWSEYKKRKREER
jgi:putative addiction module killer protein